MSSDLSFPLHEQLLAFSLLAENGELSLAAHHSPFTKTQLRSLVHVLELQLGQPLFQQQSQVYSLTEYGRSYMAVAKLLLQRQKQLGVLLESLVDQQTSQLNIANAPWFPSPWLTLLLRELANENPQLQVRFCPKAQADLYFSFAAQAEDDNWRVVTWSEAALVKVAHPQVFRHGQQNAAYLCLFDLRQQTPSSHLFTGQQLLVDALQAELGWAVLPEISIAQRLHEGRLTVSPESMGNKACYLHIHRDCPKDVEQQLMSFDVNALS